MKGISDIEIEQCSDDSVSDHDDELGIGDDYVGEPAEPSSSTSSPSSDEGGRVHATGIRRTRRAATRGRTRGRPAGRGITRGGRRRRGGAAQLADLVAEPGWQKVEDVNAPIIHPFREQSRPTSPLPYDARAIDFFIQMFGVDFFDSLAEATNVNAAAKRPLQQPTDDPQATSDPHWHATTAVEIQAFVGLNIAMGLNDLPEYRDYNRLQSSLV